MTKPVEKKTVQIMIIRLRETGHIVLRWNLFKETEQI